MVNHDLLHLDITDLYVLSLFSQQWAGFEVADELNLTNGAITHRLRKLDDLFGNIGKTTRKGPNSRYMLNARGKRLAQRAVAALQALDSSI